LSEEVVNLIAQKFIQRSDVKAFQHADGSWHPERTKITRANLEDHLSGKRTMGHYLLDADSNCKLFAFDVDLEVHGWLPTLPKPGTNEPGADPWNVSDEEVQKYLDSFTECGPDNPQRGQADMGTPGPRAAWQDRSHIGRFWMKFQFHTIAHLLGRAIEKELEIPWAATYSGAKGIHVYGFTGKMHASDVREAAMIALDSLEMFEPLKGANFFCTKDQRPTEGYPNLSIETFPKQSSLEGKDLGNLMRLPLGRNLKSPDPTFFLDMTTSMADLKPVDPVYALTGNPWLKPSEF
jgi:hypothetical protein